MAKSIYPKIKQQKNDLLGAEKIIAEIEFKKKRRLIQKIKIVCIFSSIILVMVIIFINHIKSYALAPINQVEPNTPININAETKKITTVSTIKITKAEPFITYIPKTEPFSTNTVKAEPYNPNEKRFITKTEQGSPVQNNDSIYNNHIPIPKEHQEYLYKLCKERGLDYKTMLAVMKHESQFNVNCITNNDYGYFQINTCNHEYLSKVLNTSNTPLDPYININWGTYMMSDIYKKWGDKGYSGNQLNETVWSEYNEGPTGLATWGLATNYVAKVYLEKNFIDNIFK